MVVCYIGEKGEKEAFFFLLFSPPPSNGGPLRGETGRKHATYNTHDDDERLGGPGLPPSPRSQSQLPPNTKIPLALWPASASAAFSFRIASKGGHTVLVAAVVFHSPPPILPWMCVLPPPPFVCAFGRRGKGEPSPPLKGGTLPRPFEPCIAAAGAGGAANCGIRARTAGEERRKEGKKERGGAVCSVQ